MLEKASPFLRSARPFVEQEACAGSSDMYPAPPSPPPASQRTAATAVASFSAAVRPPLLARSHPQGTPRPPCAPPPLSPHRRHGSSPEFGPDRDPHSEPLPPPCATASLPTVNYLLHVVTIFSRIVIYWLCACWKIMLELEEICIALLLIFLSVRFRMPIWTPHFRWFLAA